MGNCCSTPLSDKRGPVFLVDVGTGDLSTVSTVASNTQFYYGSDLNPFSYQGDRIIFKRTYKTARSAAAKAGPLLVFPIETTPNGSKPWAHPQDTENTVKALFNHLLFHGGEQVFFASWVDIIEGGSYVAVITSLGRAFLIKGKKVKDTFHVGDVHTLTVGSPGEVQVVLSPVHPSTRDAKLPTSYSLTTSPAAAEALAVAVRAVSRVLYANAPPQALKPALAGRPVHELPLPAPAQDGGFHSAYCMWHNMHAAKVERGLADRGEGAAPNFELVNNASSGDWSGATAIVSVRAGLKRLELDITGWDALATEAAAWAMRYNNVFKTFKAGAKVSSAAVLLCPILEYNSVLLKFQMEANPSQQHERAAPQAMAMLGNALARNPAPGFAEINISGNDLGGDAAVAWAGGLGNLRKSSLVFLDLRNCGMVESGSTAVLEALLPQSKSLGTLKISGNRLQTHGTTRLSEIISAEPLVLQTLELENCQATLASLGSAMSMHYSSLKSLNKLDVSGNAWAHQMTEALRVVTTLRDVRLCNTAIQPDALQELMLCMSGRGISLDLSHNPAVGAPNGLASMLGSGIGVARIVARECEMGDEGLYALLSTMERCNALKALDIGMNATSPPSLKAFYKALKSELSGPEFLGAVAQAMSVDAAIGIYATAVERASLMSTNGSSSSVPFSDGRMKSAAALTMALMPQKSGQALEELSIPGSKEKPIFSFGPLISMPIHLALHINTTLTKLDISNNGMGDAGARILGTSLRQNRTLTSLRMDGNGVELEGLQAIRGCLHGNQKLVELPFLDEDMESQLKRLGQEYLYSLQTEVEARIEIGKAYKVYGGGRVHQGMYGAAMSKLKTAKQIQSRTMQQKNKLRTTASQIQGDVVRNQVVAEIKAAKQLAKKEDTAAVKAMQSSSKASDKLDKLEASNKKRAWEKRYQLMKQWSAVVKGAGSSKASTVWWSNWLNGWGKPYLTKEGLDSLWGAVPPGDSDRYLSIYEYSVEVFAEQKELSDQIKELRALKVSSIGDAQFHQKEAEYYNTIAAKNPAAVASVPPPPGILNGRKPGDVRGNFTTYGGTDWAARRSAICSDINNAISKGPPKDFEWQPAPSPNAPSESTKPMTAAQAAACGIPMLAHGEPVHQVQGVAVDFPPPGTGMPMSPEVPPPNYVPSVPPTPHFSTAPPPGYPVAGPGQVGAAPYRPPEAPQAYQAAAAAPGGAHGYHFYNSYLEDEQRFQNRPPEYHNYYHGPGRYGGAYNSYGDDDYYYDRYGHRRSRYGADDGLGWILPAALLVGVMSPFLFSPWYGGFFGWGPMGGFGYGGNYTEVNNYYNEGSPEANQAEGADQLGDTPPAEVADANATEVQDLAAGDTNADGGDTGGEANAEGGEAEGMDMYGGAGPRDLPDGGSDGRRNDAVRCTAAWRMNKMGGYCWEDRRVCMWFESRWAQQLARAEQEVLGVARPIPYKHHIMALPSKKPAWEAKCTLVTQASMDRRPQILAQARAWGGRISLALYIAAPRGSQLAAEQLQEVVKLHAELEAGAAAVDISLLWAIGEENLVTPGDSRTHKYDRMYPVNALRNLALAAASTELVFLLDVDFQPSKGLMEAANGTAPSWDVTARAIGEVSAAAAAGRREMVVVAAFEVTGGDVMPSSKRELRSLIKKGDATGFHVEHFPQGHGPTDYGRWMDSRRGYGIAFQEYFEPYVIAVRGLVPPYDERFRGYGMNKISHLYTAAASGFSFKVAPEAFVAAFEHKKSESWEATFGRKATAEQKVRISSLYRRFKQELRCVPEMLYPLERQTVPPRHADAVPIETSNTSAISRKRTAPVAVGCSLQALKRLCRPQASRLLC